MTSDTRAQGLDVSHAENTLQKAMKHFFLVCPLHLRTFLPMDRFNVQTSGTVQLNKVDGCWIGHDWTRSIWYGDVGCAAYLHLLETQENIDVYQGPEQSLSEGFLLNEGGEVSSRPNEHLLVCGPTPVPPLKVHKKESHMTLRPLASSLALHRLMISDGRFPTSTWSEHGVRLGSRPMVRGVCSSVPRLSGA